MQWGFCFNGFWSGVTLTGNETGYCTAEVDYRFWSSVTLTGNETNTALNVLKVMFWSGVTLIGVLSALAPHHHAKAFLPGLLPHDSAGYERI